MTDRSLRIALDVTAVPERPAGAGRYTVELAQALASRADVALTLVTRRDDEVRWRLGGRATTLGVAPGSLPGRLAFGELFLGRALARGSTPDVLHGPHYTLPIRSVAPSVVTVHDLTMWDHPEWHERSKVLFFRRALRLASGRADVVVVPSQSSADAYRALFGDAVPVRVIAHGVDHRRFVSTEPSQGADQGVLARHGVEWPYVLSVGTYEPRKNLRALVAAFTRLAPSLPDVRLVLVGGSGWKNAELDEAMMTSPVADRIVRLGYLPDDDVPALLRCAGVVAYPAFVEGFGLPALEALACGAPLVTSAGSAMAEVTGDAALLIDPADVDGLAQAIVTALAGGEQVERRRTVGLERAAAYTWDASAAGHVGAYRLALERSPRRPAPRPA